MGRLCFKFQSFTTIEIGPKYQPKKVQNCAQNKISPLLDCQSNLKYLQSVEILPNLVTLLVQIPLYLSLYLISSVRMSFFQVYSSQPLYLSSCFTGLSCLFISTFLPSCSLILPISLSLLFLSISISASFLFQFLAFILLTYIFYKDKFLFHKSYNKFDRQIKVSNQINHKES